MSFGSINLENLSFWANIGSLAGVALTVVAFFLQVRAKKHYKLLIRGPELLEDLEDLEDLGSRLNDYDTLTRQERKTVLKTTRTLLRQASTYLRWNQKFGLWRVRSSLWWQWTSADAEKVEAYYAEVQGGILDLNDRIRDKPVEQ